MKYEYAPIKEAIFDIRIDNIGSSTIDDLEKLHSLVSKEYPTKKKQINFTGKIEFKEGKPLTNETGSEIRGFFFINTKGNRQVQFRLDGFTFNMLNPYSEWSDFSTEALRLWKIYQKNLAPKNVIRIALRYINRIELQLPITSFQDYFINIPPIPKCLPQSINNFFMQINVPCDKDGTGVIITETVEPEVNNKLPFILDIDAYKVYLKNSEFDYLKTEFNKLRNLKNQTFEDSITEKTRALIK